MGENQISQVGTLILFSFVITYSTGVFIISSISHLFFPSVPMHSWWLEFHFNYFFIKVMWHHWTLMFLQKIQNINVIFLPWTMMCLHKANSCHIWTDRTARNVWNGNKEHTNLGVRLYRYELFLVTYLLYNCEKFINSVAELSHPKHEHKRASLVV